MKILPKKADIDKQKIRERKAEIDAGIALAKQVDALREARQTEEKNLLEYRANALKVVQAEIDKFIVERESLKEQVAEARVVRDELLKPLNKEWVEVRKFREENTNDRADLLLGQQSLKLKLEEIEKEKNKISHIASEIKQKQDETEKAKGDALLLKGMAQREYDEATAERGRQNEVHERRMAEVAQREREYESAQLTLKREEKEVADKESDIIIREQDLARQIRNLQIARGVINKDDTAND